MNVIVMVMQLDGMVQGPSEGMMLTARQRNRIIRFDRSDRMLTPGQLWKPIATKHHEDGVEHRDKVNGMSQDPGQEQATD